MPKGVTIQTSPGLYEQFKRWFKEKYGWFQSFAMPANDENLPTNQYYQLFLQEMKLPGVIPQPTLEQNIGYQWETGGVAPIYPETPPSPEDEITKRLMGLPIEEFEWTKQYQQQRLAQEGQLTPWQQWQMRQTQEQFDWEKRAVLEQTKQATANWNTARFAERLRGQATELPPEQIERMAQMWNEARQSILSTLKPFDWIAKYQLENLPNPFQVRQGGWANEVAFLEEEKKTAESLLNDLTKIEKRAASDPNIALTPEQREQIDWADTHLARIEERLVNSKAEQLKAYESAHPEYRLGIGEKSTGVLGTHSDPGGPNMAGVYTKPQPTTPPVPEWLAPVIGQAKGTPIQKGFVPPSAQWLAQSNPEQRQMLGGWLEWSQPQGYATAMELTEKMLPRNPSLGRTWQPARQRV